MGRARKTSGLSALGRIWLGCLQAQGSLLLRGHCWAESALPGRRQEGKRERKGKRCGGQEVPGEDAGEPVCRGSAKGGKRRGSVSDSPAAQPSEDPVPGRSEAGDQTPLSREL